MNKLVFFGNERLATGVNTTAPTLQALISAGYQIQAVVVAQESGENSSKSRKSRPLEIVNVAKYHNIPVLVPQKLSDIIDQLASYKADAGILAAFGKLVPQSVIDIFPRGIINIHPSLLPAHRGSIPIEAALLSGDPETGVSLMQLVRTMDGGPVYAQSTVPLMGTETKQALADRLLQLGTTMLIASLPAILDGSLVAQPQPDVAVVYDQRLSKDAGRLNQADWNRPAKDIERMVRAFAGWPRVRTNLAGTEVILTAAHILSDDLADEGSPGKLWVSSRKLGVHTRDSILVVDRLIPANKKEMTANDFLSGRHLLDF